MYCVASFLLSLVVRRAGRTSYRKRASDRAWGDKPENEASFPGFYHLWYEEQGEPHTASEQAIEPGEISLRMRLNTLVTTSVVMLGNNASIVLLTQHGQDYITLIQEVLHKRVKYVCCDLTRATTKSQPQLYGE